MQRAIEIDGATSGCGGARAFHLHDLAAVGIQEYAAAAAGRPVVFVGDLDGEIARQVGAHRLGAVVAAGEMLAEPAKTVAAMPIRKATPNHCHAGSASGTGK